MASPVTDSLYLSAMLPSDFSIVFQPPMVVGQRPRATSPLPTRAYSVRRRAVADRGFHFLCPSLSSFGRATDRDGRGQGAKRRAPLYARAVARQAAERSRALSEEPRKC